MICVFTPCPAEAHSPHARGWKHATGRAWWRGCPGIPGIPGIPHLIAFGGGLGRVCLNGAPPQQPWFATQIVSWEQSRKKDRIFRQTARFRGGVKYRAVDINRPLSTTVRVPSCPFLSSSPYPPLFTRQFCFACEPSILRKQKGSQLWRSQMLQRCN